MIKKSGKGYKVYNHTGKKPLSKSLSLSAAKKRLREIEYFKATK